MSILCRDTYIVRVYRRDPENQNSLVGMVEIVDKEKKQPFRNYDELRHIMAEAHEEGEKQKDIGMERVANLLPQKKSAAKRRKAKGG